METPITAVSFNYACLEPATRSKLQEETAIIHTLKARMAENVILIGQHLVAIRDLLPKGQFSAWLTLEFGWNRKGAYRYMLAAQRFGNLDLSNFQVDAMHLLARDATPEEARQEAIDLARSGTMVNCREVTAILGKYRATVPTTVAERFDDSLRLQTTIRRLAKKWTGSPSALRAKVAKLVDEVLQDLEGPDDGPDADGPDADDDGLVVGATIPRPNKRELTRLA